MEEYSNPDSNVPGTLQNNEKQMAMFAHLGGLAGFVFPFGNIIVPVIIWATQKETSAYVAKHSLESINFQISLTIAAIVAGFLCFVLIGFPLLILVGVLGIVFPIIAAIKANDGFDYRYPMTVRLVS